MDTGFQQIDVNGLTFHCRLDGREGAPWMVFSNSLLTNLSLWDAQVDAFRDRFRILRYDQRGHGGTTVPPGPASLDQLTEDAAALMRHFGISDAVFVGVSMGAATAFYMAARHPDLVKAVVASDGQSRTAPGGAQAWQERIDFARQNGMAAFADATLKRWFAPAALEANGPAIPRVHEMVLNTPEGGFVACAQALQSYDIHGALPELRQPALLIAGEKDGAMPKTMQELAGIIPDASYVEIPGAGHLPCIEEPETFNAAMHRFLEQKVMPAA